MRVCACLKCDTPGHWAITLCCCGTGYCPCHPESTSRWCWSFCQFPGACERCIYTDTLSQARQFHQTKGAIEIQDRRQAQKPLNTLFPLCTHPHMEKRETWKYHSPRQTCKHRKLLLSIQAFFF